jgi:hypothetical protein
MDGIKTWQAVITDLGYIVAITFLAYHRIISGDAALVGLGIVGGAMAARRISKKRGDGIPPSAVTGLFTGLIPDNGKK